MASVFTAKEAKHLIQEHKQLLDTLNEMAELSVSAHQDVQHAASLLNYSMEKAITREMEYGITTATATPSAEQLLTALYCYQNTQPIVSTAKEYYKAYESLVEESISLLKRGTNGFQWLFTSGAAKRKTNEAYTTLQQMRDGSYAQSIQAMAQDAAAIRNTPAQRIWDDFESHREAYQSLFHQLAGRSYYRKSQQHPFQELLDQLEELEYQIASCDSGAEADREVIKEAAQKLAATEALSVLRDIPVEEMNRERGGIRVKTLRDHGYSTMADIYAASAYQLASIHGISEDAAHTIKRLARKFAEQAQENAKIRLSADKRTKEATALVSAICIYRYRTAKRLSIKSLYASQKHAVAQAKKNLQQLETAADWLFLANQPKNKVRDSYVTLKQYLSESADASIRQCLSDLETSRFVSSSEAWSDFTNNSIAYFNILEDIVPGILGNDDSLYGLPEDLAREIQEEAFFPDGLLCTLRRYQEWGVKYILHQERVLLGDEMGLGKTIQAIAAMVSLRNTGATHFMVVCPASVLTNWCREIRKMSKLAVTKIHGADRFNATRAWVKTGGVAVTTYETTGHILLQNNYKFSLLVVDEAHYIKNPTAQRTTNVKLISEHAERLLFMTGTALENKVDEMISLIKMLQPEVASSVQGMEFLSSAPQFRKKVAPVYYRRKREDVLTELPELIENREWCVMGPEEEAVYEAAVLAKRFADARRVSWSVGNLKDSSKARRMMEMIEEAKSDGRKVIVFSYFLDTIRKVTTLVGDACYGPINGSITPQRRQEIIDEFDKAPAGSVLAAQIQAGGTGLNIQSASVVIICEPQFKPSIENQAISRAYRMGQTRNVLVFRLLCEDSVDERITAILEEKQAIFDAFADESVAATKSMELDDKTFGNIIEEEIDRINAKHGKGAKTTRTPN